MSIGDYIIISAMIVNSMFWIYGFALNRSFNNFTRKQKKSIFKKHKILMLDEFKKKTIYINGLSYFILNTSNSYRLEESMEIDNGMSHLFIIIDNIITAKDIRIAQGEFNKLRRIHAISFIKYQPFLDVFIHNFIPSLLYKNFQINKEDTLSVFNKILLQNRKDNEKARAQKSDKDKQKEKEWFASSNRIDPLLTELLFGFGVYDDKLFTGQNISLKDRAKIKENMQMKTYTPLILPYIYDELKVLDVKFVKNFYRFLAKSFHPDLNKSPNAVIHMKRLNSLYEQIELKFIKKTL